jgi:lipopolysaccharide transport system ATP-binding protein
LTTSIKVENLSKLYRLGQIGTGTISKDMERWFRMKVLGQPDPYLKIGQTNDRTTKGESDVVYSLQDINFEIEQGDAVGIIGRNGAGKSTLLKILSRVTAPTTGRIQVKGRVASLLEVGTGFHPELSGRENIYLNGAILGMRKKEITRKLDEIIDFSGVERYIDTPVKRYSSGMYVRLAFAVAAHLESEILIVDEVLAVGDAEFQKKCLGKMGEVSKGDGRTVLFVSHNMAAVKSLCKSGILLRNGQLSFSGETASVVANYMLGGAEYANIRLFNNEYDNDSFKLLSIRLVAQGKNIEQPLTEYDEIHIETTIDIKKQENNLHFTFVLKDENGDPIFTISHVQNKIKLESGINKLVCKFPKSYFNIGAYHLDAYVIKDSRETIFVEKDILSFNIQEGERDFGAWMGKEPGIIKPVFNWTNEIA